jgi:hypothetical protein
VAWLKTKSMTQLYLTNFQLPISFTAFTICVQRLRACSACV